MAGHWVITTALRSGREKDPLTVTVRESATGFGWGNLREGYLVDQMGLHLGWGKVKQTGYHLEAMKALLKVAGTVIERVLAMDTGWASMTEHRWVTSWALMMDCLTGMSTGVGSARL
jgi:hypothetical protein